MNTQLPDGRPSLLIDPGSRGNLAGSQIIRGTAQLASDHNLTPSVRAREKPLNVTGVGQGGQSCGFDCTTPIMLTTTDGRFVKGTYTAPTVQDSELPQLFGLQSLRENNCVLDMVNLELHMCGPGGMAMTPSPGTSTFKLEVSPSGHLVLPCGAFAESEQQTRQGELDEQSLTLHSVLPASLRRCCPRHTPAD